MFRHRCLVPIHSSCACNNMPEHSCMHADVVAQAQAPVKLEESCVGSDIMGLVDFCDVDALARHQNAGASCGTRVAACTISWTLPACRSQKHAYHRRMERRTLFNLERRAYTNSSSHVCFRRFPCSPTILRTHSGMIVVSMMMMMMCRHLQRSKVWCSLYKNKM